MLIGGDEPHYALMASSLAFDRDLQLADDYEGVASGSAAAGRHAAGKRLEPHVRRFDDRTVPSHPIGLPLLASPFVALMGAVAPAAAPDILLGLLTLAVTFVALIVGIDFIGERYGEAGVIASLLVYFTTPLWYYSRTFFTEPYIWSFLILGAVAIVRGRAFAGGLLLGVALWMKESSLLLIVPLLWLVLQRRSRRSVVAVVAALLVLAWAWMGKNFLIYGAPFETFQPFHRGEIGANLLLLFTSPTKGIVYFAPLLVLGGVFALLNWRSVPRLLPLLAMVAAQIALTAAWADPGGGWCYGPRLLVPAIPAVVPFVAAALTRSRPWALLVAACALAGFLVQWMAVTHPFSAFGNLDVVTLLTMDWPVLVVGMVIAGAALRAGSRAISAAPVASRVAPESREGTADSQC